MSHLSILKISHYNRFLLPATRLTQSASTLWMVDPALLNEFVSTVLADEALPRDLRAFIALALSSGGRVSEILSIKKSDLTETSFSQPILKKRLGNKARIAHILPVAREFVKAWAADKSSDQLFSVRRETVLRWIQSYISDKLTVHSLRHSTISKLVSANLSTEAVANFIRINSSVVQQYVHAKNSFRDEALAVLAA